MKLLPPAAPALACKLTTPALQHRQATVLASLKQQVITKKELADGFAYEFAGTDAVLDELVDFIKTERQCCGFFTFQLTIQEETQTVWLALRGPVGVKDIIHTELAL
jgi:hypothetical protein